jgi:hypothetical protein
MQAYKFALSISVSISILLTVSSAQELTQRPANPVSDISSAPGRVPNSHSFYQQLRNVVPSGESSAANNLVLKRDAGTFTFRSGVFYFLAPVNGKVTGAVFTGSGSFSMVPPVASEKRSLSLLTKEPAINEEFDSAVLRFTDGTYEEIKKAAGSSNGVPTGSSELGNINNALKKKISYNLTGRLLQDVLTNKQGKIFFAFMHGRKFNDKELFAIDPRGVTYYAPEEVLFQTWDENKFGVWAAFHFSDEYANNQASGTQQNAAIDIVNHKLNTQIEKSAKLNGDAITTFVAREDGLQVVPFDLFGTLRVQSVTGQAGEALDFIQEDKEQDPQFFVILPKPLAVGETYSLRTIYSGKEAVSNEGQGNYYPVARDNWFPNSQLGDFATYEMVFRVPKGLTMVAAAGKVKEVVEGEWAISEWKSRTEQSVSGFNLGKFKTESKKLDPMDFEVHSFANTELPNNIVELQMAVRNAQSQGVNIAATLDSIDLTGMMKKASAEGEIAIRIYTDYFGATPFKRISMTQQTAGFYGQSWPELVFLPITSFMDNTIRFQLLGSDPKGYFKVIGPHEVAHQWWGHTVGWSSYRDQWMSEGFSELSASLVLQAISKNNQEYIKFWNDERELMTEKNVAGFRAIDVGPVTMGYRLGNEKTGFDVTRRLIYPKGGYILHMLRMMMWDRKTGDEPFKVLMRDFVQTYTNKPASTEDFKAMVEKHMSKQMDLDGNHRMDWFFNHYVYGTTLPNYRFEHSFNNGPEGSTVSFKITQSNVTDDFKMLMPVYLELADGKVIRLGSAPLVGNNTLQQSVPLGQLKGVKRAILMYNNDVLGTMDK